jgi:hypothetical protein
MRPFIDHLLISSHTSRLTHGFSKKVAYAHAMALHFLYYNFVPIRKSITMKE